MGGTTAVLPVIRHFGAKLKQAGVTSLVERERRGMFGRGQHDYPTPKNLAKGPTFSHYDEIASGVTGPITISNCIGGLDQIPDLAINDTYWTSCYGSYSVRRRTGRRCL